MLRFEPSSRTPKNKPKDTLTIKCVPDSTSVTGSSSGLGFFCAYRSARDRHNVRWLLIFRMIIRKRLQEDLELVHIGKLQRQSMTRLTRLCGGRNGGNGRVDSPTARISPSINPPRDACPQDSSLICVSELCVNERNVIVAQSPPEAAARRSPEARPGMWRRRALLSSAASYSERV